MNKVVLIGRVVRNPEIRYSSSDTTLAIARYSLAVKKEKSKEVDFIDIVAFGDRAEFAKKYFLKGNRVGIKGRINQNIWVDASDIKHCKFEIVAKEQQLIEDESANKVSLEEEMAATLK